MNEFEIDQSQKDKNDIKNIKSTLDNKADKTYVDENLNLKRNKTEFITMNDLAQDVKTAMTGGSVAVVGKNSVFRESIVDKQVDYSKTNFFELNSQINLFNNTDYILGATLSAITGGNGFHKTDGGFGKIACLKVKPSTQYSIKKEANVLSSGTLFKYATASFLYSTDDGNKVTDGLYVTRNNSTFATFTTTSTDQYLYIYFDDDVNADCYIQVLEGTQTNFVSNEISINPISKLNIYKKDDIDNVLNGIPARITVSPNLYNRETTAKEYQIIDISGNIVANDGYHISDWIPVKPLTTYIANSLGTSSTGFGSAALYDSNKTFISRASITSGTPAFTTTATTYYIRLNVGYNETNAMINEGATLKPYEPYGITIDNTYIKTTVRNALTNDGLFNYNKYILPPFGVKDWYKETQCTYTNASTMAYTDIYAGYDALVSANPSYITKAQIGIDQSGLYPIYAYTFKPTDATIEGTGFNKSVPKMIITTGTHGSEKPSIMALLNLMTAVCNKFTTNEVLQYLRFNIQFIIVPIVNPWGYVNNARVNSNHVDINRNFNFRWSTQGSTVTTDDRYRGTSAMSEAETQAIASVMNNNLDSICLLDFHTLGSGDTSWELLYRIEMGMTYNSNKLYQASSDIIKKITASGWKNHNVPTGTAYLGKISYGNLMASVHNYAEYLGILGLSPECAYTYVGGTDYAEDINNLNVEFTANMICNSINALLY